MTKNDLDQMGQVYLIINNEGVSKQNNWHILFLFCFVFQKSFKPPILD